MSVNYNGSTDYSQWQKYINQEPTYIDTEDAYNYSYMDQNSITQLQGEVEYGDYFVAESGETCTDGKDDGKIGLFSKIGNTVKGIGKGLINTVKGAFTDKDGKFSLKQTLKTVAIGAVCCIPYVGPAIGIALAGKGIINGVSTMAKGIEAANSATTDAEAKLAWQTIGEGGFTTGASIIAGKAGIKVLKGQVAALNGVAAAEGSGAANIARVAKGNGLEGLRNAGFKEVGRAALQDTGANIGAVVRTAKEKTWDKGKNTINSIKENGLAETARNGINNTRASITNKLNNTGEKINQQLDKLDQKLENISSSKQNAIDLAEQAKLDGAQVETYSNGQIKKATYSDGSTIEYSRSGNVSKTTNKLGQNTTQSNVYTNKTNVTEIQTHNADGKLTSGYKETTNNSTNISNKESLGSAKEGYQKATFEKVNNNTNTGIKKQTTLYKNNGPITETTYTLNGKTLTDPTLLQKAQINLQTNNSYQNLNNNINTYYNGIQNFTHLTDAELYALGVLSNSDEI